MVAIRVKKLETMNQKPRAMNQVKQFQTISNHLKPIFLPPENSALQQSLNFLDDHAVSVIGIFPTADCFADSNALAGQDQGHLF